MKGFIVLLCTVGTALTAPQYNYNPPNQGGLKGPITPTGPSGNDNILGGGLLDVRGGTIAAGPSFAPSSIGGNIGGGSQIHHTGSSSRVQNFGSHSSHSGSNHIGGGSTTGGLISGSFGGFGGSSGGGISHGSSGGAGGLISGGFGGFGGSTGGGISHGGAAGVSGGHHQTIVSKQFFIHSAPEEQDEIGGDKVINLGPGRKHYRVVFIKAPHQGVQGGKVRFIAPANEEKTVIYVLSKKTDIADIAADVQQAHSEPTKPDVFFIKYKTQEEAQHAQRTIQAQYDQLGGTSQISDEGFAPVQSVIGALGHSGGAQGGHQGGSGGFSTGAGSTGFGGSHGATDGGISTGIAGGNIGSGGHGAPAYLPPNH